MTNCEECGNEFIPRKQGIPQRFCSSKCQLKNWFKRHPKAKKEYNERHYAKTGRKYWNWWYRKLREELVNALGGKCQKCGYDKYIEALEIHHLDPNIKDGQTNMGRLTKQRVEKIIQEWKEGKIKLLCANCHREKHIEERETERQV